MNTFAQDHAEYAGHRTTQVRESDTSGVRSMRHLACVPTGKEEGLVRLQRVNLKICLLHSLLFFICVFSKMLTELEPSLAISTKGI